MHENNGPGYAANDEDDDDGEKDHELRVLVLPVLTILLPGVLQDLGDGFPGDVPPEAAQHPVLGGVEHCAVDLQIEC